METIDLKKKKLRFQRHLIHALIAVFVYTECEAFVYYLLLKEVAVPNWIYIIPGVAIIPGMFSLIVFLDSVSTEQINPLRLAISCILATLTITSPIFQNGVVFFETIYGDMSFTYVGIFSLSIGLMALYIGIIWLYYSIVLFIKSPYHLKKLALLNLCGGILAGIIAPIAFLFGFQRYIPGFDNICVGLGLVCTGYAFWRNNQLAFILPFQVYRLMIINSAGLQVYKFVWTHFSQTENSDEDLIPAMFSGVETLFKNTINKGEIREVHLDQAILIFEYSKKYDLDYILVTNQVSISLRQALQHFMNKFEEKFQNKLLDISEFSQFNDADVIIKNVFSFIP